MRDQIKAFPRFKDCEQVRFQDNRGMTMTQFDWTGVQGEHKGRTLWCRICPEGAQIDVTIDLEDVGRDLTIEDYRKVFDKAFGVYDQCRAKNVTVCSENLLYFSK